MKQITTFLLGGLVFISFAAATTNIMTVKPATPKSTVSFWGYRGDPSPITAKINKYSSQGYIVKGMVGSDWTYIVVMEKY
ncbi:MAG TPA: hypothetical protein VLA48_02575 [Nitrososphaeraceae archaeon]|nr:hypothetical protein [Nitrososphaeraceae archaeon]